MNRRVTEEPGFSRSQLSPSRRSGTRNVPVNADFSKTEQTDAAGIARLGRYLSEGAVLRGLASRPSQSSTGSRFFNASI